MPQTPNPHRMGAPLVYTFPIATTPDGSEQPTGLPLAGIAVLWAGVNVTTAEVTGTSKRLGIGAPSRPTSYARPDVSAVGVPNSVPDETAPSPAPGEHLIYKAGSNDWAEFRGTLKVIYAHIGSL